QVKVSIQNIKPEDGTFDVIVRDFYDTDAAPVILERFSKCNLVEGDAGYIAYKIGTSDGGFVAKSKYILVEMADTEDLRNNVPAGFLGYPIPSYGATDKSIDMKYNTLYNPQIKAKKQYFGISDITGIDVDMLSYKGRLFYDGSVTRNGFHMDSSIDSNTTVYVDGVSGYKFTSVSDKKVTATQYAPRLINAAYINQTLYADIKTRKFTVCFYGGFDGWDVNRTERTNTDKYKASKYAIDGSSAFTRVIAQNDLNLPLNLPLTAITSDYYAYLAGYRVFANPQDVDINVFATPGINWYDHTLLTEEAIDVIEDTDDGRGGDALYIMASPKGMDASELAQEFADKEINSSYACTYAPWVMYYDASNKRYLDLPVTKDVVRNMAATDNNSYPWFAPAGIERGNVNCVKAEYKTTLADEDELYENRVNPVKSFAQDGVKIWGNKTAYTVESPLNRINVRRLMIRVKKLVTNAAKNLIFTQYDDTLEKQFRGLIDPILADVKANRGISDYRILTEVTPETRDQHILPAKILIKPTPALEYISISFVVYPESVSFDEN
ncbi:MAG: phage tail sheath subtilisin-like domain-containing protein, partial [Clostridia bacterium]|nr:phage tail sheath subtilisin-like domain-containing protein [Clostridia bacterium]